MCAALNSAGHADACATNDGDALLFGAETLFHTLKLSVSPSLRSADKVSAQKRWFLLSLGQARLLL